MEEVEETNGAGLDEHRMQMSVEPFLLRCNKLREGL
jgi:hypothetical protein